MTVHRQVWIKVNAQVDAGIASLIEALNAFPGIRSLESCEGAGDAAWVCFDCNETDWKAISEFVLAVIGPPLMAAFGDRVTLTVTITDSGLYRAEMTVDKSIISAVAEALKQIPGLRVAA